MQDQNDDQFNRARQLWAGRFQGVISTHSAAEPGYPFGSLVPYCLDRAGLPVFLFSHLAQHAHNLATDPRCALTLSEPVPGDVQQGQRLTCIGECAPIEPSDPDAIGRYLEHFPDAQMYYEQLNFRPYRLTPRRFHYNGGFATARWLGTDRIVRPSDLDPATEATLRLTLTESNGPQLQALLPPTEGQAIATLRIAGIDPWGLNLGRGDKLRRIDFPRPLGDAEGIGAYLATLLTTG
jgi:heme oxygenase (biliverdin-IX-beta and delta-forming)